MLTALSFILNVLSTPISVQNGLETLLLQGHNRLL